MSKWTKWLPHKNGKCPVDRNEIVRVKFHNGFGSKEYRTNRAGIWSWNIDITHYKRLKANVEPEPEMWVTVFQNEIGANYAGAIHNEKPPSTFSHSNIYIGTYKLVKDS